jgi:hypothetical protein
LIAANLAVAVPSAAVAAFIAVVKVACSTLSFLRHGRSSKQASIRKDEIGPASSIPSGARGYSQSDDGMIVPPVIDALPFNAALENWFYLKSKLCRGPDDLPLSAGLVTGDGDNFTWLYRFFLAGLLGRS